jgi:hypothetical protein
VASQIPAHDAVTDTVVAVGPSHTHSADTPHHHHALDTGPYCTVEDDNTDKDRVDVDLEDRAGTTETIPLAIPLVNTEDNCSTMEDKHHPAVVAHILLHNGAGDSEMVPI